MFATRILATAGTLTMAAALLGGLASSAQASPLPVIYGVITGPHSITLAVGSAALPGEVIRPETPGYGPNVTVTSVSGQMPASMRRCPTASKPVPISAISDGAAATSA